MKKRASKTIRAILWLAFWSLALVATYYLLSLVVRDMHAQRYGTAETREVYADAALAPSDTEIAEVEAVYPRDIGCGADGLVVYVEGYGEAPAWYNPTEPMSVEWYAEEDYFLDVPLDRDLQAYIHGLCEESGLPYTLAVAVIEAESSYIPWAVSASGDYGLMQINAVCHDWLAGELGITDFLDPYQNVRAGIYILSGYYRQYGYESGALMAYNLGQGAAEALFAQGVYSTDYSARVMEIQARLEAEGTRG